MVKVDWNPDRKKLKQFGLISLAGFGVIGLILGIKFGWFAGGRWLPVAVLWGIGVGSAILALTKPEWLKPLYLVLTAVSAVIGPVIGNLIMGLIFLFVFLPIGLVFRALGRDELARRIDPEAGSYWGEKPPKQEAMRYFRQF